MEYVVGLAIWIAVIVYFMAQGSKKETSKERYAEAVDNLAHKTAESVGSFARDLAESSEQKELRRAKEVLAERNGRVYRCDSYESENYLNQIFTVDDYFKRFLKVLNLTDERWQSVALDLFYIGILKRESRDINDYTRKLTKESRQRKLSDWSTNRILKVNVDFIKKACDHFSIPLDEWVQYGDAVLSMHDVYEDHDLREYGYVCQIMPMKNNLHLL